eukprot:4293475-Amphidinium_carterae.1
MILKCLYVFLVRLYLAEDAAASPLLDTRIMSVDKKVQPHEHRCGLTSGNAYQVGTGIELLMDGEPRFVQLPSIASGDRPCLWRAAWRVGTAVGRRESLKTLRNRFKEQLRQSPIVHFTATAAATCHLNDKRQHSSIW